MEKWKIYIREACTQVEFAKLSWTAFLEAETKADVKSIFLFLQHFLAHTANVDKIFVPQKDNPKTLARTQMLSAHVDLSGIDLRQFRKLRNHLEHFDERLDKWVSEFSGHTFFDMNLVTGAQGFPKSVFLRALDGHIYKFQGEDYDLDRLYETLLIIEGRLCSHRNKNTLPSQSEAPP
jgi:hypothetical protein